MTRIRKAGEHRIPVVRVQVILKLPWIVDNGAELTFIGEGGSYDHAQADLQQQLNDWQEAVNVDSAGERMA